MGDHLTFDLGVFVPIDQLACMNALIARMDGSGRRFIGLFLLPVAVDEYTWEAVDYVGAHFANATEAQKNLLMGNACPGVLIVEFGEELAFPTAAAQLGRKMRSPDASRGS